MKAAAEKKGVTGCCLKGFFYRKSLLLTQHKKYKSIVSGTSIVRWLQEHAVPGPRWWTPRESIVWWSSALYSSSRLPAMSQLIHDQNAGEKKIEK